MKLTNNLLNNQNYILGVEKRSRILHFYYRFALKHQYSGIGTGVIIGGLFFIFGLFFSMWVGKTYGELYFIFIVPFSFLISFYITLKLWGFFRYYFSKNKFYIVIKTFLDIEGLEDKYKTSYGERMIKKYFFEFKK